VPSLDGLGALFENPRMARPNPLPPLFARTLALCAIFAAASAAGGPRDPLYQWTDAAGAVRYTTVLEQIPEEQRSAAVIVSDRGAARPAVTPPSPAPDASETSTPAVEAAPPAPTPPINSERLAALDARIAEIESGIAADEAALGDYISDPERATRQRDSGEVAEIADRLPRLQSELRELRQQRDAIAGAAPNGP
jgi:hypothetical protein